MSKYPKWLGLSVIAFVLVVAVAVVEAQQASKLPRIGFLATPYHSSISDRYNAFLDRLIELGYMIDKNIAIERRSADGKIERLPELAAELVRLKVDIIVTGGPGSTRSAKEATAMIPVVMAQDADPVGNGFVASLGRPGGGGHYRIVGAAP